MQAPGSDTDGREYTSPSEMWAAESGDAAARQQWYSKAVDYWAGQPETYDGVLGGYGHVSPVEVRDSAAFLKKVFPGPLKEAKEGKRQLRCVDCGAGVGRVSAELLLHHFHEVDLLEPVDKLLKKAEATLSKGGKWPASHRAVKYLCQGLQEFHPEPERYDVVWIQWALLYLTDEDCKTLFDRCRAGLKADGIVVVKENICKEGFIVDKSDSSLTRSDAYMLDLFARCGVKVLANERQKNFPRELFDVRMYALQL
eukprot:jgi/Tetstr1/460195/TSEL_005510.t1